MSEPGDIERLRKRIEREKLARQTAEQLLEERSLELYHSNEALKKSASQLQNEVERQTMQLRQALDQAGVATRAKDEFLANLSHEVRTPLNALMGLITLLKKTSLSEEQSSYLQLMHSSSASLLEILNDVLDFSKIEAGKLVLENVGFSLMQWAEDTVIPHALQASAKGVKMHLDIDPALPPDIMGDPGRLRQVLVNLLSNAVKFTKSGSIHVKLMRLAGRSNDPPDLIQLGVKVRDTGLGMNSEQQEHIFDAFTQADSSTTRRYGGTGLGLAICKRLVQAMNGKLSVVSAPGQGSEFRFYVPVREASRSDIAMTAPMALDASHWRGLRLLVAEDQPINQLLIRKLLESTGCHMTLVSDGLQAVQHCEREAIDLILMDVQMPVMDGMTATAEIRKREKQLGKYTRIIALTAHAMPGDQERCLAAGMNGYVTKPLSIEALNTCVRQVLSEPVPQLQLLSDSEFQVSRLAPPAL
ncbi:MAG: response regulator [Burkholderiales bacterium]|nr:MAG: response regulator [Burkholderiales bacterium]